MICLFCRGDSSGSRSREHIIPQSLGNTKAVLAPGTVCDKCNNYFSREVERPFLESAAVSMLRSQQRIPSKKGHIPPSAALLAPEFPAVVRPYAKGPFVASVYLEPSGIEHLFRSEGGLLLFPESAPLPSGVVVSRFVAKAALEAMADRLSAHPDGVAYLASESQLDAIRNHARRGETKDWPVHVRRIYGENAKWIDENGSEVQVVHEFDILQTDASEWYFVLALFGLEFAINYGGPDVDGYKQWLEQHGGMSPLYSERNKQHARLRPIGQDRLRTSTGARR